MLGDPHEHSELSVRGGQIGVLEKEEVDLPEAGVVDSEQVALGPVLTVGERDVERGQNRMVDVEGIVESRRGVVNDLPPDELNLDGVSNRLGLVVYDAEDH